MARDVTTLYVPYINGKTKFYRPDRTGQVVLVPSNKTDTII